MILYMVPQICVGLEDIMTGKDKCKALKIVRAEIAKEYGIEGFEVTECPYDGPCAGTCPACEAELERLTSEVRQKIWKDSIKKRKESLWYKLTRQKDGLYKEGVVRPPKEYMEVEDKIKERLDNAVKNLDENDTDTVILGEVESQNDILGYMIGPDSMPETTETPIMGMVVTPEPIVEPKDNDNRPMMSKVKQPKIDKKAKVNDCFGVESDDESKDIWD